MRLRIDSMKSASFLILIATLLSGCYYDNVQDVYPDAPNCGVQPVSYSSEIRPILDGNCTVCHNNTALQGGISLETYNQVKIQADNGKLVGSTAQLSGFSPMPKGGKLSQCNIDKIKKWVADGAPNN